MPGAFEVDEVAVAVNVREDPPTLEYGRLAPGTVEVFAKIHHDIVWHRWQREDDPDA